MRVGRNDPCPCGSGKKHKNCCLLRAERAPRSWVDISIAWLEQHYRRGFAQAIADFYDFALFDEDQNDRFLQLSEELQEMVSTNASEWLFADGEIEVHGVRRRVADLLLGPGGPPLALETRQWIQNLADHPLELYEVQEAVPGEGVWVKDVSASRVRRRWVFERSASQSLYRWDLVGARIVPAGEKWVFSGAIYSLPRRILPGLKAELRSAKRAATSSSGPIISCWLQYLAAPPQLPPRLVDAGSGDPFLLVTDHYDVTDWEALEAALARQTDVEGDRENGWGWLEEVAGQDFQRSKLGLTVHPENRLEAFARTLRRAEEGAAWLRQVAGPAIAFRTREITDPLTVLGQKSALGAKAPESMPIPPEIHQSLYRNWADTPVPVLGGATPREALQTRSGRQRVIDLLKDYEQQEERGARRQGHEPASFRFLWDELGIAPPK